MTFWLLLTILEERLGEVANISLLDPIHGYRSGDATKTPISNHSFVWRPPKQLPGLSASLIAAL